MMRYSVKPRPDQQRAAKDTIERAVESSRHLLVKEDDIEFHTAWESRPAVIEELNGVQGKAISSELISVSFNADQDGWKDELMRTVAHCYAHTFFYEKNGLSDFVWQWLIEEALGQHFAQHVFPEIEAPQRHAVEDDKVKELWPEARERLSDETEYQHELFSGSETFPRWYGHSLAYLLGKEILDELEFEDFTDMNRSDVLEIGDALFQ